MAVEKIVFLDRDGVICKDKNLLHKKEDIELIPGSGEAIKLLNENKYKTIVISNQPVVARGLCTLEQLNEINECLKKILAGKGAKLDKIYFCPHHPTAGDNPVYTKECECRKPNPGMIFQAEKDFGIENLQECYMIGDKTS